MARRLVVIASAAVGVYLLAGLGWALLALAVLVEVGWPREAGHLPVWVYRVRQWAAYLDSQIRVIGKQLGAVGAAGSGMVLLPVGVGLVAGAGAAFITLGVLTLGFGLLLDRAA